MGPEGRPTDFDTILLGRLHHRPVRKIDHPLLQLLQTGLPKRRRQDPNQLIELAIVIHRQGRERLIGQDFRVGLCR